MVGFLQQTIPQGKEDVPWSVMALVLVLCRLCNPSSELHIAEHYYGQSALADLLGVPAAKVNEQRLYRALDALLPQKEALETFLKNRLGKSKKNIEFLKKDRRRYIVGTPKSMLKQFEQELLAEDWRSIREGLEVKLCPTPEGDEPRRVFEELGKVSLVDVVLPTRDGRELPQRCGCHGGGLSRASGPG